MHIPAGSHHALALPVNDNSHRTAALTTQIARLLAAARTQATSEEIGTGNGLTYQLCPPSQQSCFAARR
jgi:hypothetical protein